MVWTLNAKLTHRRLNVTKVPLCLDTLRFSSENRIHWKASSVYVAFKVSVEHGGVLLAGENRSNRLTVSRSENSINHRSHMDLPGIEPVPFR